MGMFLKAFAKKESDNFVEASTLYQQTKGADKEAIMKLFMVSNDYEDTLNNLISLLESGKKVLTKYNDIIHQANITLRPQMNEILNSSLDLEFYKEEVVSKVQEKTSENNEQ
jgi:hypothetical protein